MDSNIGERNFTWVCVCVFKIWHLYVKSHFYGYGTWLSLVVPIHLLTTAEASLFVHIKQFYHRRSEDSDEKTPMFQQGIGVLLSSSCFNRLQHPRICYIYLWYIVYIFAPNLVFKIYNTIINNKFRINTGVEVPACVSTHFVLRRITVYFPFW